MKLSQDFSLSTVLAGAVTVLVGFTTSIALVFQAAYASGATPAQAASWIWALGLGMGLTCVGLSLRYRMPVVTAWSTAGAAMLISTAASFSMGEVVGAFVISSVLTAVAGFSGIFQRFMHRVPLPLAAGMLAGVLLRIGVDVFVVMAHQWQLPLLMLLVYLLANRWLPRYCVLLALFAGVLWSAASGQIHLADVDWQWAYPVWVSPSFSMASLFSLGLPLFIITMASQNIPGVATLRANGFEPPLSPVIGWIGLTNVVFAPFGAFALNLAAITASICAGPHAHPLPAKRYTASVRRVCGRPVCCISPSIGGGDCRFVFVWNYFQCAGRGYAGNSAKTSRLYYICRDGFRFDLLGRGLSVLGFGGRCLGFVVGTANGLMLLTTERPGMSSGQSQARHTQAQITPLVFKLYQFSTSC